jgi:sugar lactone lactonase YvrE
VECTIDDRPSGLGWLPDGRLLMSAMTSRQVRRREHDGSVVVHADLSSIARFHCNDMVVDEAGRAYVGNFGFDLDAWIDERGEGPSSRAEMPTSTITRVDPDGSTTIVADGLMFPNGTVITPDGRTMVVAESMGRRLTAFTITADGGLTDRRVWAGTGDRVPDGICLDADGHIWVANAGGPDCVLLAEGGEVLEVVDTGDRCFACMLGGDDRRTLYTLASKESHADRAPLAATGTLRSTRVDVPAAGWP